MGYLPKLQINHLGNIFLQFCISASFDVFGTLVLLFKMPSSLLFAINNEGRVFGLSTNGTKWREFIYLGLEFKQLSAVPNFLWAVGGDRQIYVHAHGLDIPIRVKEEAYENERWTPFDGFSKRLLPTDRYSYSNADGTVDRTLKKIRLPSMAWQWEGDWKLELNLDGQPLDHDGWTYAVDFPATYYPTKQWTSCVRRRKWVRYRKYIALNSWCAIAPLHKDPTQEPFIGVSVGGNQLPGSNAGTMLVWAVTAYGRVMFRTDVSNTSPEGQRWMSIPMPHGCEVSQISVGATGLVWVVLWNGKALVRSGITRESVTGTDWLEVEQPGDNLLLNQVSIGNNGLWGITRDFRVWFRKGIQGENSGVSDALAKGSRWVEMCGQMSSISVASNDQVWAVGAEDRVLYFRTSVTSEDLMGKTWRALSAPTQLSRTSSSMSLLPGGLETTPKEKRHRSWTSLNRHSGSHENKPKMEQYFNETCYSAPATARNIAWQKSSSTLSTDSDSESLAGSLQDNLSSISEIRPNLKEILEEKIVEVREFNNQQDKSDNDSTYENVSHPVCGFVNKGIFSEVAVPTRSWSPQHAGGTVVATEAHYAADSIVFESDEFAGVYSEHGEREEEDDHLYWADSEAFWSTVEAGACIINFNLLPKWFTEVNVNKKQELLEPWRLKIINELKGRLPDDFEGLENYEKAIDNSTWAKTGKCKCLLPNETTYRDCIVELEWICGENDNLDCGTFTLFNLTKTETWAQINLKDVTAVINCSVPRNPRLALYYCSTMSLTLQFVGENEYEEWKSELQSICCRIRNVAGSPSSNSIWITTTLGDIYVSDLSAVEMEQKTVDGDAYSIELPFCGSGMPVEIPLQAGFSQGSSLIIRGCVHDVAERFFIDLICREENGNNNIAFHFNPRINEDVVVQNARRGSVWGQEERNECQPFRPGTLFEIKISCETESFVVSINDAKFNGFTFRGNSDDPLLTPSYITHLCCGGDITLSKIQYLAKDVIIEPKALFWRQIDGHLKKIVTAGGVTWGIGFDNTVWLYLGSESLGRNKMYGKHYYYVYENQRWNPLTGYTSHGLPTDRFMWSDVTGKHKRTREKTMLLSKQWQWVSEWSIDFQTPGGVDKEGWQYAVDFPSSYHGTKHFTDYVRRRRWFRCARLETEGPWVELGYTPLTDCSLYADGEEIIAWAVAANGYILFRRGVTKSCPAGLFWEHVPSDEQMISISCGPKQVWAIGKSGTAFCRMGISPSSPIGDLWETVEAPAKTSLKQINLGNQGIWALGACGRIFIRKEVSSVFPLGSHWKALPLLSNDGNSKDTWELPSTPLKSNSNGFRQVAARNTVWAVTNSGRLIFRIGVNSENPVGSVWLYGIEANFLYASL